MDLSLDLNPSSPNYNDLFVNAANTVPLTSDSDPTGTHPVLQNILQNLRFFLGEWFLDTSKGVPWFQVILAKGTRTSDINQILRSVVLNTRGVTQLSFFQVTTVPSSRKLNLVFTASTTSGVIDYSGTLEYSQGFNALVGAR